MDKKKERIRIELTEEQRNQIRDATGEDTPTLEFTVEELEERIAPLTMGYDFSANKKV